MSVSKPRPEQAWRLRIPLGDAPQRGRNGHELQAETLEPEVFGRLANEAMEKAWPCKSEPSLGVTEATYVVSLCRRSTNAFRSGSCALRS
jgi:hypothetical protein